MSNKVTEIQEIYPSTSIKLTEKYVQNILGQHDQHLKRYDVMIPCCMTQIDNEADILAIRKSGYCDEFEIKLSRADFMKDRSKIVMYRPSTITVGEDREWFTTNKNERSPLAPWEKLKLTALGDGDMTVNYFWYVIKHGIADLSELPEYAGLITIDEFGRLQVVRKPSKLHNNKLSYEQRFKYSSYMNERFWGYRVSISKLAK